MSKNLNSFGDFVYEAEMNVSMYRADHFYCGKHGHYHKDSDRFTGELGVCPKCIQDADQEELAAMDSLCPYCKDLLVDGLYCFSCGYH